MVKIRLWILISLGFGNEFPHKPFADLIAHSAEDRKPLFIAAVSGRRRVFEALMDTDRLSGKDRESLF